MDIVDDHDDEFHAVKEIPYRGPSYNEEEMWKRSQLFYESLKLRRSVRCFSNKTVPMKIIQNIIKTAGKFFLHCFKNNFLITPLTAVSSHETLKYKESDIKRQIN